MILLVFGAGQGGFGVSASDVTLAPYRWRVIEWEITHVMNKWRYRIREVLPWHQTLYEEEGLLDRFLELSREVRGLEIQLLTLGNDGSSPLIDQVALQEQLRVLRRHQDRMQPQAEEILESLVSGSLSDEGFKSRIGLIWPPVDVDMSIPPSVMVMSPRDRIERQKTVTLRPQLRVEEREALEDDIFRTQNLSGLVVDIAGIATYPSIVSPELSLHQILITTTHEWLHQYWFFHPLGRNYWKDSNTTILNETAADLAGRELGGQIYQALVGVVVLESGKARVKEGDFNFRREMQYTRSQVDNLLAEGRVEDAETYMENRRHIFVENGFFIRKLNQAYFAFFGTYADSPASTSTIGEEVALFRASVDTVGDFIRAMAKFSSYEDFLAYLEDTESVKLSSQNEGNRPFVERKVSLQQLDHFPGRLLEGVWR